MSAGGSKWEKLPAPTSCSPGREPPVRAQPLPADAQLGVVRSRLRYRVLTGTDRLPDNPQEPLAVADNRAVDPRVTAGQVAP